MDKRYQIFISSTFADLVDERKAIQQAVLSLSHFPAGMELFPATNDDQWDLIKSVIDDSDYYIIVVGARYGSTNTEGISYTEMEFDYAVSQSKPILAFVHANPDAIVVAKTDKNDEARSRLEEFRTKVMSGRHVKLWTSAESLQSCVLQALVNETRKSPQEGWIRARHAADAETLAKLRAQVAELTSIGPPKDVDDLASGDAEYEVVMFYRANLQDRNQYTHKPLVTWDQLFRESGPVLMQEATERKWREVLKRELMYYADESGKGVEEYYSSDISNEDFETIKIQLLALGLIRKGVVKRTPSDTNTYWALTPYGEAYLMRLRAIRRPKGADDAAV